MWYETHIVPEFVQGLALQPCLLLSYWLHKKITQRTQVDCFTNTSSWNIAIEYTSDTWSRLHHRTLVISCGGGGQFTLVVQGGCHFIKFGPSFVCHLLKRLWLGSTFGRQKLYLITWSFLLKLLVTGFLMGQRSNCSRGSWSFDFVVLKLPCHRR